MIAHRVGAETGDPEKNPVSRQVAPLLLLLLLTLLGFWLRAHDLDAFSFWTDEGLTPERSGYPVAQILRNEIVIQGVITKDTHPPLYYLILHLTRQLFGVSDFAFRYPSVLFGLLLIPLIYQIGRRMGGVTVGLIAALLAAVNPLHVYYSQEARMYSLLALLATGMSYVLWRAIQITNYELRITNKERAPELVSRISYLVSPGGGRRSVVGGLFLYGVLAALALYTHYTAAFLIAAQALFWAWVLWRAGLKWAIVGAAGLGALAAIPLIPYTLPRLLAGAEANYYYVPPLTMLLDVVRFFNLGLTVEFAQAFVVALNALAFGLMLLGVWAAGTIARRPTTDDGRRESGSSPLLPFSPAPRPSSVIIRPLFLLTWLLAVVLGLMAGSVLFKPMYQGVRHIMIGSPAFLLLVAFGVWAIWSRLPPRPEEAASDELTGRAAWAASAPRLNPLALIPLGLLMLGAAVALVNLYTDPAYAKDDFRSVIRFIETRAGARDVIVYNNAVLLPLHEHYRRRPDIAVTALPAYPQFATGAEPELAALARDYDRVWFVTDPPADKRDEGKLIRRWLDANLTEVTSRLFPARTTEARVIAYSTTGAAPPEAQGSGGAGEPGGNDLPCAPSPLHPCPLSQLPALAGVAFESPLALPTLWVDLVWRGERPRSNPSLIFTLAGPDGQEYYREARSLLSADGARWDDAAPNRLSYQLPLPPGLPPGTYTLAVAPEGGDSLPLGRVEIAPTSEWPVAPELLFGDTDLAAVGGRRTVADWSNGLTLAAVVPWDDAVLPGNNLPLTLYWRVGPDGADLSDLRYRLEVVGGDGAVLRSQEDRPGAPWLGRVPGGALLREVTALYVRPETEPGRYRLRWTLLDGDAPVGGPVTSGRIRVAPWPLVTDVPAAAEAVAADFGPDIRLRGYERGEPDAGRLPLTLYWQARAEPRTGYVVFIHLVDEAGQIVSQADAIPAGGARPTTGWRAGEVIADTHSLPIPDGLPPGLYHLNVGLYNPDDGTRPAVTAGGAPQPDNQLPLATLDLPGGAP